jgi:hypothetical chaperone protein
MGIVFGIDFGTTNSALSIYNDGKVDVIGIDDHNPVAKSMRSVLYFNDENKTYVGQDAINNYISDGAAGRFMQSIKTFLPSTSFDHTTIYGKKYTIEDLIYIILNKIKQKGEAYVGSEVENVVMGRPVIFSENKEKDALAEKRLTKAARKAGFKNIWFQYEPVAAALTYEATLKSGEEKFVLIGDFGGGTSDFTVIKVKGGTSARIERKCDVLSLGGIYIAGDKFDSQIMWEKIAKYFGRHVQYKAPFSDEWLDFPVGIIRTLCQWHRIPLLREKKTKELIRRLKSTSNNKNALEHLENIIHDNYGFILFQAIEKAKCALSSQDTTKINFEERDLLIHEDLNKHEFESINHENFENIARCVDEVIVNSGISHDKIDTVFLTGGTSYIPYIQQIFIDRFGKERLENMDAFTSVAHGLGASAPLFV